MRRVLTLYAMLIVSLFYLVACVQGVSVVIDDHTAKQSPDVQTGVVEEDAEDVHEGEKDLANGSSLSDDQVVFQGETYEEFIETYGEPLNVEFEHGIYYIFYGRSGAGFIMEEDPEQGTIVQLAVYPQFLPKRYFPDFPSKITEFEEMYGGAKEEMYVDCYINQQCSELIYDLFDRQVILMADPGDYIDLILILY